MAGTTTATMDEALLPTALRRLFDPHQIRQEIRNEWQSSLWFVESGRPEFGCMYGFPLTIYLLSGWLQTRYPGLDLLSHDAGHLWSTLLGDSGLGGDPHFGVFHLLSFAFIGSGFWLLSSAWNVLYHAQRRQALATQGPYARIRHPQYVAFVLVLLGFLLQWPTLLTLLMFPVLLVMYGRLAVTEERAMQARFGAAFEHYAAQTPRFIPRLTSRSVSV